MEVEQKLSSIELNYIISSSNTPNDVHTTRYFRNSLHSSKCRDYKKHVRSTASKILLQRILPPTRSLHVGTALKEKLHHHWIDCIFLVYNKIHTTDTLSYLFSTSYIDKENPATRQSSLSFEVKITNINNFYELKCRLCADRFRMTEGVDFSKSYVRRSDTEYFHAIIALAASKITC